MLVLLLLIPLAQAGPGHVPLPVDGVMPIHFQDDGSLAMHPSAPTGMFVGEDMVGCEPAVWQAGFTRSLQTWQPELARAAVMKGSVDLVWFVDLVVPGTDVPLDHALPLAWTAQLRSGSDLSVLGDGELLAQLDESTTLIADGDAYQLQGRMNWITTAQLPAEGFQLEISLHLDTPCEGAPTIRAISDEDHRPRLLWKVFDPVRIDLLEATTRDTDVQVMLHASSPWGRDYLNVTIPTVTGADGAPQAMTLLEDGVGLDLQQTYAWASSQNGTYKIKAFVNAMDGSSQATDEAIFRIGGEPQVVPVAPPVEKESPGLPLLAGLLVLVFAAINKNKSYRNQ